MLPIRDNIRNGISSKNNRVDKTDTYFSEFEAMKGLDQSAISSMMCKSAKLYGVLHHQYKYPCLIIAASGTAVTSDLTKANLNLKNYTDLKFSLGSESLMKSKMASMFPSWIYDPIGSSHIISPNLYQLQRWTLPEHGLTSMNESIITSPHFKYLHMKMSASPRDSVYKVPRLALHITRIALSAIGKFESRVNRRNKEADVNTTASFSEKDYHYFNRTIDLSSIMDLLVSPKEKYTE